jgi:hypothetical protein
MSRLWDYKHRFLRLSSGGNHGRLNQLRFDRDGRAPHNSAMREINETPTPNAGLVAAVFCAIIGLIAYAGFFLH